MQLTRDAYQQLVEHARREAPVEACGYLGGSGDKAEACLPLKNMDASPEHFSFDPADQFSAVRHLRKAGQKVLAVYHSHPTSPARPSDEDLRLLADPDLLYAILSLQTPEPVLRLFQIRGGQAAELPLSIIEG